MILTDPGPTEAVRLIDCQFICQNLQRKRIQIGLNQGEEEFANYKISNIN